MASPTCLMVYRVEIGARAEAQLADLDSIIGAAVERKIVWLAENAAAVLHRRLACMPEELAGLCKLRVGDWRILYWVYHAEEMIRVYRIQHRSEVYRQFWTRQISLVTGHSSLVTSPSWNRRSICLFGF